MDQPLTVYIIERKGIEHPVMQDLIELFSGTILASATPDRIDNIIKKRGYLVTQQPK